MSDLNSLEDIAQQVSVCTDCALSTGRTNAVPGEGSGNAQIMFIGEGPGYHEDRQGRPFVGPAGSFLDDLFKSIGLSRDQVFIANKVKCRPPNNRDPLPGEITACSKYLDRQIELIRPGPDRHARSFLPGQVLPPGNHLEGTREGEKSFRAERLPHYASRCRVTQAGTPQSYRTGLQCHSSDSQRVLRTERPGRR